MVESLTHEQRFLINEVEAHDAIDLFIKLRPNEEVPEALLAAHGRAIRGDLEAAVHAPDRESEESRTDERLSAPGLQVPAPASRNGVNQIQQAHTSSSAQHFVATHSGCQWAPVFSTCRVEWSNGYHSGTVTSSRGVALVDHYTGNGFTVRLTAGGTSVPYHQAANDLAGYIWGLQAGQVARSLEIYDATGDGFHVGVRWE